MLLRNVTKIVYFTMEFFSLICTVFFMICAVINAEAEGMPTEPKLDIQIEKNKVSFQWTAPPWQISVIQFNIRKYTQISPTNKFTNVRRRNFTANVRSFETSLLPCFSYGVIIRITNTSGDVYDIQKKFFLGDSPIITDIKKADGNYHGRQKYILTQEQHLEVDLKVESNPQPEFLFYRRKNKYFEELSFKRDPITTTYTVQFPQMSCYDSGNYTLEVNNGINNSAKIHLYLEIQWEPESVKNLSVYDITKESALIQWIAGFDGGSMQRFYVQLQKNEDAPNTMNVMTSDTTEGVVIMYRINSLLPKTVYQGVVVAKNKYGKKPTKFKFKTGTDESDLSESEVIIYSFTICFIVAVVVVFVLIIKWRPELFSRLIQKNVKTVIYDDSPADDEIQDLDPKNQSVVYENQIAEEQGNNSSKKTLKSVDRKCVIPEKSHSKGELPVSDQCVSPCSRPIENKVQVSVEKHSFPSDDMYSVVHKSDTNDAKRGSPVSKPNGDKDEVLGDDINDDNSKEAYLLLGKGINVPKSHSYDRLQENKKDNNVAIDELTEDCVQEAYETMTLGQG